MEFSENSFSKTYQLNGKSFLESLTVDTGTMRQKASTVEGKMKELQSAFEKVEQAVQRTGNYWIGEAGDAHRAYFEHEKPKMEEILRRLSEHARDLNAMASVYERTEREAADIAADLPSDAIT